MANTYRDLVLDSNQTPRGPRTAALQDIEFPVRFTFKITTLANDFVATDASGQVIAYVRQKLLKLKEAITVYADASKTKVQYTIQADRWLDFSAAYSFKDANGVAFGKVARKGWRSLWKARYELIDENQQLQYHINEENGWVKVLDAMLGEIPFLGLLTGYFFNPSYLVTDTEGKAIVRLKKEASFWGRKFELTKVGPLDSDDDDRVMLGLMMMVLLERRRG